jgi:DNA-binding SARP family transcriptional activator
MPVLHLFGTPRLAAPGGDVLLSAREAALLTWLHLEGPSPRARVAGLLWPGGGEVQARANLRQTLARLKRSAGELLAESAGVLQLAPDVTVAAAAPGSGLVAHQLLGPLEFDDAPEFAEWLQARREAAVRDQRREQLAQARRLVEAADLDAALGLADAVLAIDSAVEDAHRLRMEVFYLRGDRAAAITAWDDCRDALRRAYGIAPSAATNELGRLVLAAEAADQQHVAQAQRRAGVAAAVLPAALRRPPQTVGRDGELATIARAFAMGYGVVVAGPGGMGKSRLIAQAAAAMEPAVVVGARPGDEQQPGMVASRLVAAAVERFAPVLDSDTRADIALLLPGGPARGQALRSALQHRRVLASVARTMLACHARGMRLVVVDDLQFADELSMEAMAVVVGGWLAQPPDSAALPLFGCRPDELRPAAAALVALLEGSVRCTRIDLAPLGEEAIQALLQSLPLALGAAAPLDTAALGRALYARVGGNPAFVLESVKALWLGGLSDWRPGQPLAVPATLLESLRRRLLRLSPEALQLAQLAAVAREDFSLPLAAAAQGRPALALAPLFAELEAAQVLEGIRFSHDLVAEAAQASLPAGMLAPLHQLVADQLRVQGGAVGRIAWHLQKAGDDVAAVPWHLAAARAARDRWQLAEAARSFEAAALGWERLRREHAAPPSLHAEDPATVATAWLQAARWWTAVSDYPAALRALERGFAAASTAAERLELRASQVVVLLNAQRHGEAAAQAAPLVEALPVDGHALPVERQAAHLFACAAVAPYTPHPEQLAALCESLRARCEAGPPRAQLSFHLAVGTCLNWLGQPAQAQGELQRARTLAEGVADHGSNVNVTQQQVRNAWMQGDGAAALAAAQASQRAVQVGGYGSSFRLHAAASLALAALAAGQPAAALQALKALGADLAEVDPAAETELMAAQWLAWHALGLPEQAAPLPPGQDGWLALARWRRVSTASERQACLAAMARTWPAETGVMGWRRRVMAAALRPSDAAGTTGLAELAAELRTRALWPLARQAHGLAARAALAAGAAEDATTHARQACALVTHIDPWTDEPAAVWAEAAAVLRDVGAAHEADQARDAGLRWLAQAAEALPAEARAAWLRGRS